MKQRAASFDASLISGYLDGELTQAETQRIRLHLENDPTARGTYEELKQLREATTSTQFHLPRDDQWDESPRGGLSLFSRGLGWLVLVAWTVSLSGFALWQLIVAPGGWLLKLLALGAFVGFGLLLLSVLMDRIRAVPGDRYRRVQK